MKEVRKLTEHMVQGKPTGQLLFRPPKKFTDELGWKAGDFVDVEVDGERIILKKTHKEGKS